MNDAPYRTRPANDEPADAIPNFHAPAATPTRWRFVVWAGCLLTPVASLGWTWLTWTAPARLNGYRLFAVAIVFAVIAVAAALVVHLDAHLRRRQARRTAIEVARLMSRDNVRWDRRATVRRY